MIRRLAIAFLWVMAAAFVAGAQGTASHTRTQATAPASCITGDITTTTSGTVQLQWCKATNSWFSILAGAQYAKLRCEPGLGDGLNSIPVGTYSQFTCINTSGVTWTIASISCWTDNSGSSTLNAKNNAGTALLTAAVTCNNTKSAGGAAATLSSTTTLPNNDAITFTFVADGTTKETTWTVSLTQ